MITDELLQFIQNKLGEGVSREEIETILITQGNWSKENVDEAFRRLENPAPTEVPPAPNTGFGAEYAPAAQINTPSETEFAAASPSRSRRDTSRAEGLPLLPILAGVAVLGIGVVLFVLFGSGLGGHRAATTIDGFLADFIQGVQKIEKFEYEVTLNVAQEEQDGSVEPLTVVDPTYETRIEAVERDVELFDGFNTIKSELKSYEWNDRPYPASMDALGLDSTIPLDKFIYRQLNGGTGYEVTIHLEADETINYINEKYSDSDGVTVDMENRTVTVGSEFDRGLSGAPFMILAPNPVVVSVEAVSMYAQFLPARFQSDVTFSGVVGLEQEEGKIPDTENALTVNVDWGDASFAVDGALVVKDEEIYGQVNRFPSLFFFDIEPIRGKWVHMSREDAEDSLVGLFDFGQTEEDEEALSKLPEILAETVSDHNPFILKEKPRTETLEGGGEAIAYSLGINGENVAPFYEALYAEVAPLILEEEELESMNAETERALEFFATDEFSKVVDYLNEHATFEIWMDKSTGYPVQYVQELVFVPNPDMLGDSMGFFGTSEGVKNTQLRLTSTTTLRNINKNISVEAPQGAISLDEATALMFGEEAVQRGKDAEIRSALNTLRAPAELYRDETSSYAGFCEASGPNGASESLEKLNTDIPTAKAVCHDAPAVWAVEAILSDGTYYYVDASGQVSESEVQRLTEDHTFR